MKEKILVAMSGGVDSAVAAHLIMKAGYEAIGVTMQLTKGLPGCENGSSKDIEAAQRVCKRLGIAHQTLDLGSPFRDVVIRNFIDQYKAGYTPNPCVVCNKTIKFGALLAYAESIGCAGIATGHYAKIEKLANGRFAIKKAIDDSKDQTYMLWSLSQEQLSKILFPLGTLQKTEVRAMAAELSFENAQKKDSQDICFIPNGNYVEFIEKYDGYIPCPGDFIDSDGHVLGKHKGLLHYTTGQRKGLGIALGAPMFVLGKSAENNTVTLGQNQALYQSTLTAEHINLISVPKLNAPIRALAKARYRQVAAPAVITQTDETHLSVTFDSPVRAITPGQSVAIYDGDVLLGGGFIQ